MKRILYIIQVKLPKKFTRKQFNMVIRDYSITSHPEHYLQRLVECGKIKHIGAGTYAW